MHSRDSLSLGMMGSLIPHVKQPPINLTKKVCFLVCHKKLCLEKGFPILYPLKHYAFAQLKNHVGYWLPQYLRGSGLKLVNIGFGKNEDCITE